MKLFSLLLHLLLLLLEIILLSMEISLIVRYLTLGYKLSLLYVYIMADLFVPIYGKTFRKLVFLN